MDNSFGNSIAECDLKIQRAKDLLYFLQSVESSYIHIVEFRQKEEFETIIIDLGVERPQKIINDIKKTERLAIKFDKDDISPPEVFALREDFPTVPHLNLWPSVPFKSLCLYEESYETIKLTWKPSKFINQIQNWLNKTAIGELHESDQALEPFIMSSPVTLILPETFSIAEPQVLDLELRCERNHFSLLPRNTISEQNDKVPFNRFVTIGFSLPSVIHGIIHHNPRNLKDLHELLSTIMYDFNGEITKILRALIINEIRIDLLEKQVIFLFMIPLKRDGANETERFDHFAFMTVKTLKDIGAEYGVFDKVNDSALPKPGIIIGCQKFGDLESLFIDPIAIQHFIGSATASLCNNTETNHSKITAIGIGALGSQIINNLIRSGFGRWKLIDEDILLPHNVARHFLSNLYVGFGKAKATMTILNTLIDEQLIDESICENILRPTQKEEINTMLSNADFIFDFSASIAVSRYITHDDNYVHAISTYLTPDGQALVVACEDENRNIRLDWLEMLQYREVINNNAISDSLNMPVYHRYGNSCRDISVQLSQDDFAIWSGFASKKIRELVTQSTASMTIFCRKGYDIKAIICRIHNVSMTTINGWKIIFDDYVINKMSEFRVKSLPNETGGILLGNIDTYYKHCYIVDIVRSPLDSEEQPNFYIRGYYNLYATIENMEKMTLGQISYIGEWHSHPKDCSVNPSALDIVAYSRIKDEMEKDALPIIMMIVGDNKEYSFVNVGYRETACAHP
jgi:integrative and conjugative element protein (TIGR02256 family)